MKKIIITALLIVLVVACTKNSNTPTNINLGVTPTTTSITAVNPVVSNGSSITIGMNTTLGAKYSLQAIDFKGNTTKILGFTASNIVTTQTVNLSALNNGDYTILLIDVAGNQSKSNIVIKH